MFARIEVLDVAGTQPLLEQGRTTAKTTIPLSSSQTTVTIRRTLLRFIFW